MNMSRLPWITFLAVVMSCAVAQAQQVVAHRGASFDAPENTLAAFRLAWEMQADAIEGDFYLTADKQIVCIHDKTTKRTAPGSPERVVAKSTLKDLRMLDVGSWKDARFAGERIPTLSEVLQVIPPGKQIFLEIKCGPEIVPVLKQQLQASTLRSDQIVIICFREDVVAACRRAIPQCKANWLTSYKRKAKVGRWQPEQKQMLEALKNSGATGIGSKADLNVVDESLVQAIQSAGFEFHFWTVNEAKVARQLQKWQAASITTDRPGYIRNILKQNAPVNVIN